jgi:hypothetical protein
MEILEQINGDATDDRPICFVVMGYEKKTDPVTSKVYDLDKSFRSVIKKGVEDAGFRAVRSDMVMKPGQISRQMYQLLMDADLVVCDLTTLNVNAVFELGVRMAFRPKSTVVIAAEETKIPFNLNQERLFRYKHGGEVIDYEDAAAAQVMLTRACKAAVKGSEPDSLIYTLFHQQLEPPRWFKTLSNADVPPVAQTDSREFVREAKRRKDWTGLIQELARIHDQADTAQRPLDGFFTQQWALATYKQSETPEGVKLQDLLDARDILERLTPRTSTDAETLGLWAATLKRLSEHPERDLASRKRDLNSSIASYRKGYILRQDHYNGANYAFLMLRRAVAYPDADEKRNIRDRVEAAETWSNIVELCAAELDSPILAGADKPTLERGEVLEEQFWRTSSLALAFLALKDARYQEARDRLRSIEKRLAQDWMMATADKQETALKSLMGADTGGGG